MKKLIVFFLMMIISITSANFGLANEKKERIGGKCQTCSYKEFCGGGCRADAYNFYGDYLAPDPMCIPPGGWYHE